MRTKLPKIDGKTLKGWYEWLKEQDCGCCCMKIGDTELHEVYICMGWHQDGEESKVFETKIGGKVFHSRSVKPVWKIAWKIGWQSPHNAMQCDLDVDFDMPGPCNKYGDAYNTLSEVVEPGTMKDWNSLAGEINKAAKDAFKYAVEIDKKAMADAE